MHIKQIRLREFCFLVVVGLLASELAHAKNPSEATHEADAQLVQSPAIDASSNEDELVSCVFPKEREAWLDSVREASHRRLCLTARWLDGRFGDSQKFDDKNFRGKISIALAHDSIEGVDPRLRVRVRTKLPNVSSRFSAFVGRVEENSYVSNTEGSDDSFNTKQLRSNRGDDADWLIGLGYQNPNSTENGFDYSLGAKLSSGINPYAKVAYRHHFQPGEFDYWRATQTVFWRRDEKFGVSSNLEYTHVIGDRDILEWETSAKYTGETQRLEWVTGTTWHHSLSNERGVSSRVYFKGEDRDASLVPEYGLTFLYVRPFLRPWLNIETGIDFRWERNPATRDYESAVRIGVQFEMLLGDYYKR